MDPSAGNKPVLFKRPVNWASMTEAERQDYADHLLDLMGVPRQDDIEPDPTSD